MTGSSPTSAAATPGEEPLDEIKSLLFSSSSTTTTTTTTLDTTYTLSILHKALAHPRIFAGYAELSTHPQIIQTLEESKLGKQMLATLHLFAFGVYGDYVKEKEQYCTLNAMEVLKLRVLTVVTLVQQSGTTASKPTTNKKKRSKKKTTTSTTSSVPYSLLYSALDIPPTEIRQLEDVLIHAIYTHAIIGKLDQRNMSLQILPSSSASTSGVGGAGGSGFITACRDVDVEKDVPNMIQELEGFYNKGQNLLESLGKCVEEGRSVREEDLLYWSNVEKVVLKNRVQVSNNMSLAAGGGPKGKGGKSVGGGGMMLAEEGLIAAAAAAESGGGGNSELAGWLASSGGADAGAAVAMAAAAGEVAGGGAGSSTRGRQSKRSRGGGGASGPGGAAGPGPGDIGTYGRF